MNWLEIIKQFPAIWAVVGAVLGSALASGIFVFANRKFSALIAAQTKNLTEIHERQIVAQKELLQMQKEHYELEQANVIAAADKVLAAMKEERDQYKQKLHDANDAHNATTIEYEKLKLQPDVKSLFDAEATWHEERRTFYKEMAETMKSMRDSIHTHDQAVEKKVEPIMGALAELVSFSKTATAALQEILDRCEKKKIRRKTT